MLGLLSLALFKQKTWNYTIVWSWVVESKEQPNLTEKRPFNFRQWLILSISYQPKSTVVVAITPGKREIWVLYNTVKYDRYLWNFNLCTCLLIHKLYHFTVLQLKTCFHMQAVSICTCTWATEDDNSNYYTINKFNINFGLDWYIRYKQSLSICKGFADDIIHQTQKHFPKILIPLIYGRWKLVQTGEWKILRKYQKSISNF